MQLLIELAKWLVLTRLYPVDLMLVHENEHLGYAVVDVEMKK